MRIIVFGGSTFGGRSNRVSAFTGALPLSQGLEDNIGVSCTLEEVPTGYYEAHPEKALTSDLEDAV